MRIRFIRRVIPLSSCILILTIASSYPTQADPIAILDDYYPNTQAQARRYNSLVESFIAQSSSSSRLGFYRQQDRPEVYLVYHPGFYCHVQNEDQMNAFGGFGRVQVVSSLSLSGTNTGDCGWSNGFFRRSNQPEVYRMYGSGIPKFNIGDSFCHVQNEAQMNAYGGFGQVRVVSPNSDLGRGRTFTGGCPNP